MRRLLAMFPEAASAHVIFKTNNEKRPSLHICTKTSMNETVGGIYSFLASQATWVFDFWWARVVPALADRRFIVRHSLLNSDGDDKLYGPYDSQIPGTYALGKHRLCTFHLFTQGWQPNQITASRIIDKSQAGANVSLAAIKNWMLSWTNDVESVEELSVSHDLLLNFLEDKTYMKHFDPLFPDSVRTFVLA